jgi:hypothetical protein
LILESDRTDPVFKDRFFTLFTGGGVAAKVNLSVYSIREHLIQDLPLGGAPGISVCILAVCLSPNSFTGTVGQF